ncbi:MAG: ABC transporter substrate-binding protein [Bdellovibrionales bacterium]
MIQLLFRVLFVSLLSFSLFAANEKPAGNPNAPIGGTVFYDLLGEPNSLNPFTNDGYASTIHGLTFDTLLDNHPDTYKWQRGLAEKWDVSKDGKTYTFSIRKNAKFADGSPITIEDVKFSYDAIMDEKYGALVLRSYYKNIASAKITGSHTIQFKVKDKYFKNMELMGGLDILQKSKYENPKRKINKKIHGSGPYILEKWDRGRRIVLKRNKKWWGWNDPLYKGIYNFNKIVYRFVKDENIKIEMLKKGDLDFIGFRPAGFVKKTKGDIWGKRVFANKVESNAPKSYGYVGWNMKKPMFADARVRKALSLALNRKFIVEKFYYSLYLPMPGPAHPLSRWNPPTLKADPFDTKQALKLLREAGWADTDKDGVLDKVIDGKKTKFSFTIITAADETVKVLTTYKEDAKRIGLDIDLKLVEWQTLIKLRDAGKFDGVAMAWGGVVEVDYHQIFHSSNIRKGASNFVGYSNPKVDKWIDEARLILDPDKREPVMRKIVQQIAEDRPYLFLITGRYTLYGNTARMGKPKDTFNYTVGNSYWWMESAK